MKFGKTVQVLNNRKMVIQFVSEAISFNCKNKRLIKQWIEACCQKEGFGIGELSIVFCSDDYLLQINNEFLKHNYYTDIITFDYTEKKSKVLMGDLMISVDRVKANALDLHIGFEEELHRVIIHGVLHLMGYKDKTPEKRKEMRRKENYYLKRLVIGN